MSSNIESGVVTQTIASFVCTPDIFVPDTTRHVVQLSVLGWIAVARSGMDESVGCIVRDMVDGVLKPNEEQTGHALGLAAIRASDVKVQFGRYAIVSVCRLPGRKFKRIRGNDQ